MADKTKVYEKELLKEKWLVALETNKYRQAFGAYHCGESHCAIGVFFTEVGDSVNVREIIDNIWGKIIILNDKYMLSFPEIAKCIREGTVEETLNKHGG
jgi:hypothetical protein